MGAVWGPFSDVFGFKNRSRTRREKLTILGCVLVSILAPFPAHLGLQVGLFFGPWGGALWAPSRSQLQFVSFRLFSRFRRPPGPFLDPIWDRFRLLFLMIFGVSKGSLFWFHVRFSVCSIRSFDMFVRCRVYVP